MKRVAHPVRLRRLKVKEVVDLAPRYRRIVLGGAELEGFRSDAPDDHVKVFFPDPETGTLSLPAHPGEIDDAVRSRMRDFTPRAYDAAKGELTIDFALHTGGIANAWARAAVPGAELGVGGPRGSMVVPYGYDWYLLAGDETALPAIARRLEELPPNAPVKVLVEVDGPEDELVLRTLAAAKIVWLHRKAGRTLVEAFRQMQRPSGEGFVFAAAESTVIRTLRGQLAELGHPREAQIVSAYWKIGAAAFHEGH